MVPTDFVQYQRDISQRISQSYQKSTPLDCLLEELQIVAQEAEQAIEQHPSDRSLIDCGPGCSTCCVVNVSTLMPEGIAIARYLRSQGGSRLQAVRGRLETLWREVGGLEDEDRIYMRRPCAFLDEKGACSIYPIRPLLCRSLTSTDAQACGDALFGAVIGVEAGIMSHQFQQQLYETLFSGIAAGIEAVGLDGRSYQLCGLIRYLLRHPDAESSWLGGQRLTWLQLSD